MTHDANPFRGLFPGGEDFLDTLLGGIFSPVVTLTPKFKETAEFVEYSFPLPGVAQGAITPVIRDNVLHVSVLDEESGKNKTVYRVGVRHGLDATKAVAESKDGVLTVQVPFAENRGGVKVEFGTLRKESETTANAEESSEKAEAPAEH